VTRSLSAERKTVLGWEEEWVGRDDDDGLHQQVERKKNCTEKLKILHYPTNRKANLMSDLFQKQHKDCKSHLYRDSKKLGSARRHFRERERERREREEENNNFQC
jgi:hypothetical protein